jgi:hypothetical protein
MGRKPKMKGMTRSVSTMHLIGKREAETPVWRGTTGNVKKEKREENHAWEYGLIYIKFKYFNKFP